MQRPLLSFRLISKLVSVHLEEAPLALNNRGLFSRPHSLIAGLRAPPAASLSPFAKAARNEEGRGEDVGGGRRQGLGERELGPCWLQPEDSSLTLPRVVGASVRRCQVSAGKESGWAGAGCRGGRVRDSGLQGCTHQ